MKWLHTNAIFRASNKPQYEDDFDTDTLIAEETIYNLIVWNDEVNTFDWVIKALIDICKHTKDQAEQCALLIHFQGKYAVKSGSYQILEPMCTAILDRKISATIEPASS